MYLHTHTLNYPTEHTPKTNTNNFNKDLLTAYCSPHELDVTYQVALSLTSSALPLNQDI
jgi:hypothetical protein